MPDWSNWANPCPDCPRKCRAIGGDGPQPARILCIAERPGQDENRQGRVMCGKTGQEWDELYLPLAGLDRSEVRIVNTVLCGADNNRTPTDKEIRQCAEHHLPYEIIRTDPDWIILMGSTACSLVPGIRLDMHHGIPQPTSKVGELFGWEGILVPMYHPSIGLHESRWMTQCIEDWQNLKSQLALGWTEYDSIQTTTSYHLATRKTSWVRGTRPIAIDTESHNGKPWSVQVSPMFCHGTLYRVSDLDSMGFLRWMLSSEDNVVFHHAAHDLEVLRKLDIHVRSYRDTMQEAFHLGNLPQGLKPLVYRLFRHTMTSYQEVVWPASISSLQTWMLEAIQIAQQDLSYAERRRLKTKIKETITKGPLETLLLRLLRLADTGSEYNPWSDGDSPRLDAFWSEESNAWMTSHIEARIGAYPVLGIGNCKLDDAIRYAVGDADWTGQAAIELERRRGGAFQIYEGDRDT